MIVRTILILAMAAAFLSGGMVSAANSEPSQIESTGGARETEETYALAPGDKLKINVFHVAEMTGEYSISPSGSVALPLLGRIPAAGGTTDTLTDIIRTKLAAGYVNDPRVSVEVIAYRPFYILGEVNKPGEFPFAANVTVEQAIAAAGGYTYRAARHRAFVRRAGGREQVVKFKDSPVYVMPGDTIRVGERYL